jgi:hypothetical protein
MASEASERMRSFAVRTTVMWYARSGRLPLCGGSVGQDNPTASVISRSSSSGSARMTSPPGRFSRRASVTSVGRNLSNRENAGSRQRSGGRNGVRTVTCAGMPKRAALSCSARQRPTSNSASGVIRRSHTSREPSPCHAAFSPSVLLPGRVRPARAARRRDPRSSARRRLCAPPSPACVSPDPAGRCDGGSGHLFPGRGGSRRRPAAVA